MLAEDGGVQLNGDVQRPEKDADSERTTEPFLPAEGRDHRPQEVDQSKSSVLQVFRQVTAREASGPLTGSGGA